MPAIFFTFVMILGAAKENDLNPINRMIDIQFPLIYLNLCNAFTFAPFHKEYCHVR